MWRVWGCGTPIVDVFVAPLSTLLHPAWLEVVLIAGDVCCHCPCCAGDPQEVHGRTPRDGLQQRKDHVDSTAAAVYACDVRF